MTLSPVCFLRGTSILTSRGGESQSRGLRLVIVVATAKGLALPVTWIGRQHFDKDAGLELAQNIVARSRSRFALDEFTPHRDLYVSA